MTDDAALDQVSRALLDKLHELKDLEVQKRGEARSTPTSHTRSKRRLPDWDCRVSVSMT
jgi:hypothetical protein